MGARRRRFDVNGHDFAGWEPSNELSEEDQEEIDLIESLQKGRVLDSKRRDSLDEKRQRIEGKLIPTCECGWRGDPVGWLSPSFRRHQTGQQYIEHKHSSEMSRIQGRYAAEMAAAALDHAADAWDGDPDFATWLRARADRIIEVGYYDGEEWP